MWHKLAFPATTLVNCMIPIGNRSAPPPWTELLAKVPGAGNKTAQFHPWDGAELQRGSA